MDDELPDLGDVLGLTRLYRAACESIRAADLSEADRRAWLAELRAAWRPCVTQRVTRSGTGPLKKSPDPTETG